MAWTDVQAPRIPRGMAAEVALRLERLIEATEALLRRHEPDHEGPACLACLHAREMLTNAREALSAFD